MAAIIRTDARTKSIKELLSEQKYAIDYYQREYQWQRRHVQELMEDLQNQFLLNYRSADKRAQVEHYSHYFLGSIVVSNRNGLRFVIDGQQRLTTITLLLIFLHNLQIEREDRVNVATLIFSEKFGKKSFNLDIPDRNPILEALYNGESFDATDHGESVQNIEQRSQDITEFFLDDLKEDALPYFIDWLTECVDFVEITAFSDEEAYTIFETMNDRGLSLSPAGMLKGYLLANLRDDADRDRLNERWKYHMSRLAEAEIDDVSDFFKSWLRARYAQTIRGSAVGEENKDWEKIVSAFHKWVRDEHKQIGLNTPEDFRNFLQRDFEFYARQYAALRQAGASFDFASNNRLEYVHYNANNGYTLQYPLILSALNPDDDPDTVTRKIRVVAGFLDIFIARRFVNFKTISGEATKGRVFNWIMAIRKLDINGQVDFFSKRIEEMDAQEETFEGVQEFYLHQQNRQRVHHLLARLTYEVENWAGVGARFDRYSSTKASTRFEIEHIWANHYERHRGEFDSEETFSLYRNRLGNLILLPRGTNQSYSDQPYEMKLKHYIKENLLAQSLHPAAYERNPNFAHLIKRYQLPFQAHEQFKKDDLDKRQQLYQHLCEIVWSPQRLQDELV